MALFKFSQKQKLIAIINISFCFFVAEISVAFKTKSLALIADAFHYLNDLISFVVALVAIIISERSDSPPGLSFGWQRARLLGAFFNGVFLLALGISIFLQSIERFIYLRKINDPKLVLIIGCVGLFLNIVSVTILHGGLVLYIKTKHSNPKTEHHHHDHHNSPGTLNGDDGLGQPEGLLMHHIHPHHDHKHHEPAEEKTKDGKKGGNHHHHDYGTLGVLLHVAGDALNNIGVIIAAVVIWQAKFEGRFYADPGVGMGIAIMIFVSAFPLMKHSGSILLQSAPLGVEVDDVKHDLEKIPGIESVHELHIWRLDQKKAIASVHVIVENEGVDSFMDKAKTITECFHAYGIHSATVQPELSHSIRTTNVETDQAGSDTDAVTPASSSAAPTGAPSESSGSSTLRRRHPTSSSVCQVRCGANCDKLACCSPNTEHQ